jgi:glycosyltransferase involved in cell wall biosynthesis
VTVLYFADTRFPIERANGAQTMATCYALASRGHDVTLVVRPDTAREPRDPFQFYDWPVNARLRIRRIPSAGPSPARRARFLFSAAALAVRSTGIVYTRDLGLAAFLLRMPMGRRLRVVYESHGLADVVAAELPRLLGRGARVPSASKLARLARREARVWRRAHGYVTITQALADELTTRFGPRPQVAVVPDGARLVAPAPTASSGTALSPEAMVLGYAGHLYPWKGVDILVRALAELPGARALIIGGHPEESDRHRIDALARSLHLADRITFTGLLPPGQVATRLAAATVLVLPNVPSAISERYTSPLKLFEYLTMGKPIIASDLPAMREVLTHEETALLVTPGDPHALARAVRLLADQPDLSTRLATGARTLATAYTWERRADRLEQVLEAVA